ncbi:MAG: hypothetical protein GY794_20205 [bacterium]|nr:hypothetical protein [bacterium]
MNRKLVRFALLGILVVIVIFACRDVVTRDEVRDFNDQIVSVTSLPGSKYDEFSRYIDIYRSGQDVSVAAMESERDELLEALAACCAELKKIEAPDDELCRDFYRKSVAYIDKLRKIVDKYEVVIAYISAHNPAKEGDFKAATEPLKALRNAEGKLLAETMTSQKRLLEKYRWEINQPTTR